MTIKPRISYAEFIILMALITSLIALSIDSVLPALAIIASDFAVNEVQRTQQVITLMFLGMAIGQFLYGPIADNIGRKPTIAIGISLFLLGNIISLNAHSLEIMLVGRFLQGVGVASPRIITMSIVRDCVSGNQMARTMSFMMSIFILIPIIAPTLGFWIMSLFNWRMIFTLISVYALILLIWFYVRQVETLKPENKQAFSFKQILHNSIIIFANKTALSYTIISGVIFGVFLSYLSASQHIFQVIFATGDHFPYYFACLAASMGLATLFNARYVVKIGMLTLSNWSFKLMALLNLVFLLFLLSHSTPSLVFSMAYLIIQFFLIGILFGNLNAIAMQPLGKLAGTGAGIIGSVSTFISVPLASFIGPLIDTNITPLVLSFLLCAVLSLLIIRKVELSN